MFTLRHDYVITR